VLNGSLMMFGLMFLPRCSWAACGAVGSAQAGYPGIVEPVNNRPVNGKRIDWIKWLIWIPWISLIIFLVVQAGGYHAFDPLYDTQNGSRWRVRRTGLSFLPTSFTTSSSACWSAGGFRRAAAGCHSICWMAPFMMIGRWVRNRLAGPPAPCRQRLRLRRL